MTVSNSSSIDNRRVGTAVLGLCALAVGVREVLIGSKRFRRDDEDDKVAEVEEEDEELLVGRSDVLEGPEWCSSPLSLTLVAFEPEPPVVVGVEMECGGADRSAGRACALLLLTCWSRLECVPSGSGSRLERWEV